MTRLLEVRFRDAVRIPGGSSFDTVIRAPAMIIWANNDARMIGYSLVGPGAPVYLVPFDNVAYMVPDTSPVDTARPPDPPSRSLERRLNEQKGKQR